MKIVAIPPALDLRHRGPAGIPARRDGLWQDPPSRAPPNPSRPSRPVRSIPEMDGGVTYEVDPDFLEHARREQFGPPQLPWEA